MFQTTNQIVVENHKCSDPIPIGSMYAIYGTIYHQYTPNVSIYTIHGSYGILDFHGNFGDDIRCEISRFVRTSLSHQNLTIDTPGLVIWSFWVPSGNLTITIEKLPIDSSLIYLFIAWWCSSSLCERLPEVYISYIWLYMVDGPWTYQLIVSVKYHHFQRVWALNFGHLCDDVHLVGGWPTLWKIWVRQLGWWNSQVNGKII